MKTKIDILLAAYNSAPYIREQIDSIIAQDYSNWRLIIRDGGSTDSTIAIVEEYRQRYPEKIKLIESSRRTDACCNFSMLLKHSTADYIMFSDHDDIWLSNKVSLCLLMLKKHEVAKKKDTPLLLYTDLKVVDRNLNELSDSFFKYQGLNPYRTNFNYQLTQNIPMGCTMMINRSLANLCGDIPDGAVMHDPWLSLLAAAFGHLIFINKPTILYRQHNDNYYGAFKYNSGYYHDLISEEDKICVQDFATIKNKAWLQKRKVLLKHKILKSDFTRNVFTMLMI